MVTDGSILIFSIALIVILVFIIWCIRAPKLYLLHKLYLALTVCYATWVIPIILMRFLRSPNGTEAFILDCMTTPGGSFAPVIFLCIVLAFVRSLEHMPRRL